MLYMLVYPDLQIMWMFKTIILIYFWKKIKLGKLCTNNFYWYNKKNMFFSVSIGQSWEISDSRTKKTEGGTR